MELNVAYDRDKYKETHKKPDLKPTLFYDRNEIFVFNTGYDLSTDIVASMFADYIDRGENKEDWDYNEQKRVLNIGDIQKSFTNKVEVKSPEQILEFFKFIVPEWDEDAIHKKVKGDECFFNNYKVFIYPNSVECKMYEQPEAREARMSTISIINNTVAYDFINVYKYLDWDELLSEVMNIHVYGASETRNEDKCDKVCDVDKKYSFTLITDLEDHMGVTGLFNHILAGCLTNEEEKTKTIFNKHQAIHIWYWLFNLCQQFDDRQYRSDDYELESICEHNPYVDEYNARLKLVDSLDNLNCLMYMIDNCNLKMDNEFVEKSWNSFIYKNETAKKVIEFFVDREEKYDKLMEIKRRRASNAPVKEDSNICCGMSNI